MASPLARQRAATRRRRLIVATAVAGVLAGIAVFALLLWLSGSNPDVEVRLGDEVFDVGNSESLQEQAARHPLLFQDLLDRNRDLFVQHLGGERWAAFEAHAPGASRRCTLEWRPRRQVFRDPCDGRVYREDGEGLIRYRATVNDDDRLVVDLRRPLP